jgi:hypothetical protein
VTRPVGGARGNVRLGNRRDRALHAGHAARSSAAVSSPPTRIVHVDDGVRWLQNNPLAADAAILTSLPDSSEMRRLPFAEWQKWFVAAAEAVVRAAPERSAAVFYQTDVKRDGVWIDKSFLVQTAVVAAGARLVWHKIVCRAPAGTATGGRPGYAHLLCASRALVDEREHATPDVLPRLGAMTWSRAMGMAAVEFAVGWLRGRVGVRTIVDPFCGVGTALAVANRMGLDAIGVDIAAGRVAKAKALVV